MDSKVLLQQLDQAPDLFRAAAIHIRRLEADLTVADAALEWITENVDPTVAPMVVGRARAGRPKVVVDWVEGEEPDGESEPLTEAERHPAQMFLGPA